MQLQRCGIKRASGPQLPARRGPTPRHRHFRAHAGPEGANVETLTVPSGRTERRNDPFVDAAYRIHGLLHAVGCVGALVPRARAVAPLRSVHGREASPCGLRRCLGHRFGVNLCCQRRPHPRAALGACAPGSPATADSRRAGPHANHAPLQARTRTHARPCAHAQRTHAPHAHGSGREDEPMQQSLRAAALHTRAPARAPLAHALMRGTTHHLQQRRRGRADAAVAAGGGAAVEAGTHGRGRRLDHGGGAPRLQPRRRRPLGCAPRRAGAANGRRRIACARP